MPPIAAFVAAGFEHSVENVYFIAFGLLVKADSSFVSSFQDAPNLSQLTWGRFIGANLVPVTIGNIVGGALMVAPCTGSSTSASAQNPCASRTPPARRKHVRATGGYRPPSDDRLGDGVRHESFGLLHSRGRRHGEHRARRDVQELLCDAAEQRTRDPSVTARTDHDHIGPVSRAMSAIASAGSPAVRRTIRKVASTPLSRS